MLDGAGDDMLARGVGCARQTEYGKIVGLGAAASEDDFGRGSVDEGSHLAARGFQPLLRTLSEMVNAGRVTIHLSETRHHRLENFRSDGCGNVVIEVEMLHLYPFYRIHLHMTRPILTLTTDFGLTD